ncbi:MAG: hypothetical protein QNK03_12355 [Myxococcota bacterium]|nr:hypothetical protein [Myxococcota bacterium]
MRRRRLGIGLVLLPWLLAPGACPIPALPPLAASLPADGGSAARSAWPVLDFAAAVSPDAIWRVFVLCDGEPVPTVQHLLDADSVVVQPVGDLPAPASCTMTVGTVNGPREIDFTTSAPGPAFTAIYDRTDRDRPLPFPDDAFLVPDASTATGFALSLVVPEAPGTARDLITRIANKAAQGSDGWSPIGNLTVQTSQAASSASLPSDRAGSLDPLSTIALVDMTPGSESFGQRIPFSLSARSDTFPPEPVAHALVIFPGIPLEPEGTYGLVVTDRVLAPGGEPLARAPFFEAALGAPQPGEAPQVAAVRPLAAQVLDAAEALAPVPIPRDDVALAVRLTVRSTAHFPDDLLAMREDVLATDPNVQIGSVSPGFGDVAAFVEGSFDAPQWITAVPFVNRDPAGDPLASGTESIDFILALPAAAATTGGAPVIMYQHGSPGSAQGEVPGAASRVADLGFAVGGFTDSVNTQFPDSLTQTGVLFFLVNQTGELPDYYIETYAQQMAFVRALQSLDELDVLPLGAPDGIPDIDPSQLLYEGISYGSNHAQAFLAYEPAIQAAALVVGAVRFVELLEYQDRTTPLGDPPLIRSVLPANLTGLRAPDIWMGLSLLAVTYDRQDPHNHARYLFREPLEVDGTTRKASLLVVEGIDDSFTKNNSSRSLAWQLGQIPQLAPAIVPVPDLPQQPGPIQANLDADTTVAFVQFAPLGAGVPPTPGCGFEGHYCAQVAVDAIAQRRRFYRSALDGAPVIE